LPLKIKDTMVGSRLTRLSEWNTDVEKAQMLTNVSDSVAPFLQGEWLRSRPINVFWTAGDLKGNSAEECG